MPMSGLPQSNRQHPVPQNIMDVEFKIIGDLTMRQFAYLMVSGLSAYLSYLLVFGIFKWPSVVAFVLLGLGLAFVPIEERGLDEWIVNFFRAINTPTQKIWRKEPQLPTAFLYDNIAVVKQEMITLAPTSSRRKLEEYLRYKGDDGKEDPLDIPERAYAMKVREAYPYASVNSPSSNVGVMLEDSIPVKEELPKIEKEIEIEKKNEIEKDTNFIDSGRGIETKQVSVGLEKEVPKEISKEVSKEESKDVFNLGIQPKPENIKTTSVAAPIQIIKRKVPEKETFTLPKRFETKDIGYGYRPITPDMHSGRKFVNLVPSSGELILPIRGEKTLKTSEDLLNEENLDQKAKKLNELLDRIRKEEGLGKNIPKKIDVPVAVIKSEITSEEKIEKPSESRPEEMPVAKTDVKLDVKEKAVGVVNELETQNEELSSEIQRLKGQIERGKSMSLNTSTQEQLLKRLEMQKEKIALSYADLQQQFQELQKKLEEKDSQISETGFNAKVKRIIPSLTNEINVVSGLVRDSEDKLIPNVLMIIKNMRGEAVRAFKTNSMGQFVVSTPLQNGTYTLEVSPTNKLNLTFGIIPIEVKGEIISPLDVVGK